MTKVADVDGLTPKAMDSGLESVEGEDQQSKQGVRLKKELSLLNGVAIIVGVIIGSGIFVTPKMVLEYSGSKGIALMVWVLSGFLSMIGALCYAELGTMIPKSGGDYAYLGEAFGALPAFLYLWVALFILVPIGNAVTALTFAENIVKPLWPECHPPDALASLIAAIMTCLLTAINCYNVKWVTRVQDSFTVAKILALLVTFFAGMWYLFSGHTQNLENMMEGTVTKPEDIAIAFYGGLFSYSGWNFLNFVTEELKEPNKNLPRAICISMPVVTIVYALINVAYFAVLTNDQIISSETVAFTFSDQILGKMAWLMPLFVALCTLGSLNGAIYTSSRLFFVGARAGHLPLAISLIDIKRLTPVPSLIFMCLVTSILVMWNNIESLIVCLGAVEAMFYLGSIAGLLWMRHTQPDKYRPIRVHLIFPIVFLITCTFLVICSCFRFPLEVGIDIIFLAFGVVVYWVFIKKDRKPMWLQSACNSFNLFCSKMFLCIPEDSKEL